MSFGVLPCVRTAQSTLEYVLLAALAIAAVTMFSTNMFHNKGLQQSDFFKELDMHFKSVVYVITEQK